MYREKPRQVKKMFVIRSSGFVVLALTLVFTTIGDSAGEPEPDRFSGVRRLIAQQMAQTRVSSVAVAVATDGEILWEEGFGYADRARQIRSTPHTMYSLASVTKPLTATALMILVERDLIELKKPINDYLGRTKVRAFEGDASSATVERILHHTAGLPMHWNFFFEGDSIQRPDADTTIGRYGIIVSQPGEHFEYSNLGYGLLETVIERVSGRSYGEFMRTEVFEPLGMWHSQVVTEELTGDDVAIRYMENKATSPFYDHDARGASSIYASAHDLVTFGMLHVKVYSGSEQSIISDSAIDLMRAPPDPRTAGSFYGLGWSVGESDGYRTAGHGGGMPGVRTHLLLVPEERTVVAVLCNGPYINPEMIARNILAVIHGKKARGGSGETRDDWGSEMESRPEITGTWTGAIESSQLSIPVQITVDSSGMASMATPAAGRPAMGSLPAVAQIVSEGESVSMSFAAELPTEETLRFRHKLTLKMRVKEDTLSGFIAAESYREAFCLPFYIRLVRTESQSGDGLPDISAGSEPESATPTGTLRSTYTSLSWLDGRQMIRQKGLFDRFWNPSGDYENEFEQQFDGSDEVVIDRRSGLMWHQSGTADFVTFTEAEQWIDELNSTGYAGCTGWRLPTLEEAASLLESTRKNRGMFIDPLFFRDTWCIWTGDRRPDGRAWVVIFSGRVDWSDRNTRLNFARAVRNY